MEEVIYIGSDHAGFELKKEIENFLTEEGYRAVDVGPEKLDPQDDYPDYALKVCQKVLGSKGRGILICSSGQGMSIAANKIPGIHAALSWNEESAFYAKRHVNVNVLCLGSKLIDKETAKKIVRIWVKEPFAGEERHQRRFKKIDEIERYYKR